MKGHMKETQKWLRYLRSGTDQYNSFLKQLLEEVQKKGGFTLKNLGTDKEELKEVWLATVVALPMPPCGETQRGLFLFVKVLKNLPPNH